MVSADASAERGETNNISLRFMQPIFQTMFRCATSDVRHISGRSIQEEAEMSVENRRFVVWNIPERKKPCLFILDKGKACATKIASFNNEESQGEK